MTMKTISPRELAELRQAGAINLIDVRTPVEFEAMHVEGARNVPLDRLDPASLLGNDADSSKPIYVICRSGGRGKQACERLSAAGLTAVCNVEGGTLACEAAGLPLNRGQQMMSLERQVRIVAGSLTLVGAVLALTLDPLFAILPAFIGAGLVFAGVTDTCGMGLFLARMPWNQRQPSRTTCSTK